MAVASSPVYAQGAFVCSDKDWFHGELSRVQAEHALTASACDCFLVRVSQGALILSLLHHGQVHHLNIKYGPGWYELENGSAQYSFTELEEMVSHYSKNTISDSLNMTLGVVCEKMATTGCGTEKDAVGSPVYAQGVVVGSDKDWFHGELSKVQAEHALTVSACDCFLARVSQGTLILSLLHHGQVHHINIKYGPGWYELESCSAQCSFSDLEELVSYYSKNTISDSLNMTLGAVCEKTDRPMKCGTKKVIPKDDINSPVYAQGTLVGSDKDWFHGEISRIQAEHALAVSACDCFLVRVSQGALILSLLHHGQVHHINIHYGPGWYELESGLALYSFTELEELVSHYRETAINDSFNITLGAVCEKKELPNIRASLKPHPTTTFISNDDIYSKGEPEGLAGYKWYHGKITRDQADAALSIGSVNKFLIWHSSDILMLSKNNRGRIVHTTIHRSPKGYQLKGDDRLFYTIPTMIQYYQKSLGEAAKRAPEGQKLKLITTGNIFRKEMEVLQVTWKKCADLPVAFSIPHVVKIGKDIYAGGGILDGKTTMSDGAVFKYNLHQDIWTSLPSCKTVNHGLTSLNDELIAIGGYTSQRATNAVRTFRDGKWKAVLPPMPTPRWSLATVSHDDKRIIAAGGTMLVKSNGEQVRTNAVEIYITEKQAWFSTMRLLCRVIQLRLCITCDTCYTLGGTTDTIDNANIVQYATVFSLLENAVPANTTPPTTTWELLQDKHPLIYTAPVELDGRLCCGRVCRAKATSWNQIHQHL